jgi:hypothetical protein
MRTALPTSPASEPNSPVVTKPVKTAVVNSRISVHHTVPISIGCRRVEALVEVQARDDNLAQCGDWRGTPVLGLIEDDLPEGD